MQKEKLGKENGLKKQKTCKIRRNGFKRQSEAIFEGRKAGRKEEVRDNEVKGVTKRGDKLQVEKVLMHGKRKGQLSQDRCCFLHRKRNNDGVDKYTRKGDCTKNTEQVRTNDREVQGRKRDAGWTRRVGEFVQR